MTATLTRRFGCYFPTANNVYNFDTVERQVGRPFDVYSTFISFDSTPTGHSEIQTAAARGHDILLAWQPSRTVGLYFQDILNGKYNPHIDAWLTFLGALPTVVYVRFAHEMNGDYAAWNPSRSSSPVGSHCTSPAQFVQVWRYLVNRQRTGRLAANIRWFFCPNGADVPSKSPYTMESFYPGDSYVDVIGYDSYNSLNGHWMTPMETLSGKTYTAAPDAYTRVASLHPTAEVWIGETGCVDANDPKDVRPPIYDGHSKAQWWNDFFLPRKGLPRLSAVCFFDHSGTRNWRFDSSADALASFRRNFAGGPVQSPRA